MKTLAKFFIDNSKLTIVLSIALTVFGIMGLKKLNSESYPQVSFAMGIVTTNYDGASAEDIETKITKPIEDELRGVSGIKDVRSTSQSGLSTIFVRADLDNVDVDKVMSDIQKAIDRTTGLPKDLNDPPKFLEIESAEFPVYQIAISGHNENRHRDKIANLLKEELEDNDRVKSVSFSGYAERRFQVKLDNDALIKHHIGLEEVMAKISARNVNIPGGSLKTIRSQQLLRLEGKIKDAKELENILIRSNFSGQSIYLKDVAKVVDGEEEIKIKSRYNGQDATLLTVTKKAGADTLKLVDEVIVKLDKFKKQHTDVSFHVFNDESEKVRNKLEVLSSNAISGLILVVIFLFIFLPGRIGIMASISLPLAVMGTVGMMPSLGMNLDAITILALVIALGMLVDNSVVISENFTRLRQEGLEAQEAALESVRTLWLPITATAMTTIAAFVPMLVTKGIMGQFIKWIPIVVSISLLLSLAESFFFLPMRLAKAGGEIKKVEEGKNKDWFHRFEKKFENLMDVVVSNRYKFLLVFFGLFVLSGIFFKANQFILFPADQTETYIARFKAETGTRLDETHNIVEELSKKIKTTLGKDVKHIIGKAGQSKVQLTDPKAEDGNNVGMLYIYVTDHAKFNRSHIDVLKHLRKITLPSATSLTFEAMENGPPVGNAIDVTFRSNSFTDLDNSMAEVIAELSKVDGVLDLKINDVIGDDEVYIDIDYQKVDRLGLTVDAVGTAVRTAISGKVASTVTIDNKEVELKVRLQEKYRNDINALKQVKIMDQKGNLVPLGTLAKFRKETGAPQIKRYKYKRSKTLSGDVNQEIMTSVQANKKLKEIFAKIESKYPSVSLVFGGAAESTKESMESLFQASILACIGIFGILVFLFKSYLRPIIIMFTIPLGLLGFSIAFYLPGLSGYADRSRPISFLALIGIIGLAGIIVNSGIVLISFIDQMKAEGKLSLHEILVKASGMRLRAVLVTSLTTVSGLIPTAYGIGGSDAMLVPMTLAMASGLISGTILTLIFIPCAYAVLEDYLAFISRIFSRESSVELDTDDSEPSIA
jgi:multidrug efflux pump subunit AcrB